MRGERTWKKSECPGLAFGRLRKAGLTANTKKCLFGVAQLDFLGHHIKSCGITLLPDQVTAIKKTTQHPKTCYR